MLETLFQAALMAAAAALGWFGRRWVTGARHKEETDSLSSTVDLMERLSRMGVSIEDAREFRDRLRLGAETITPQVATALSERSEEGWDGYVDYADTTAGMIDSISQRLSQLEIDLDNALEALVVSASPARAEALTEADVAWREYRSKDATFAGLLFEGGTAAPLMRGSRMIELTEQRVKELRQLRKDEDQL